MPEIDDSPWGPSAVEDEDVALLAETLNLSVDDCVASLRNYRLQDFATEWNLANPQDEAAIRGFYGRTELYLRELLVWNGTRSYQPMLEAVRAARARSTGDTALALDHGCGVGTVALEMLRCGYVTTIADVPGPTLDFARRRIAARGLSARVLPITGDQPDFGSARFDLITSFDVVEHVTHPRAVTTSLVQALRPGGLLAVSASFDHQTPEYPHHLPSGAATFGAHRWPLFLRSLGLQHIEGLLYRRTGPASTFARRTQYHIWRRTGFLLFQRLPR